MTTTPDILVRDLVTSDFRAAAVLERYGIDFCCGGKQTLEDACRERQVAPETVLADVALATAGDAPVDSRFDTWELPALVTHIVERHHGFVRRSTPQLLAHTAKVAAVHGDRHPEMKRVADLFRGVAEEMDFHMEKEEHILFPYITDLSEAIRDGRALPGAPFGTIEHPIRMMEAEHESAGNAMATIRELTDGYRPPADGCTTYRVCLQELEAFERDLHEHVHLENNILFPKAAGLEARY